MVTYGPWRQDPDFDGSPAVIFTTLAASSRFETDFQSPPRLIEHEDLELATMLADDAAKLGIDDPSAFNEWGMAYSWTYNLSFPDWKTGWVAESAKRTLAFAPGPYIYRPDDYGYHDPSSIGIDWQDRPYDPEDPFAGELGEQLGLRLLAATRFFGFWDDTSLPPNENLTGIPPTSLLMLKDSDGNEFLLTSIPPRASVPTEENVYAFLGEDIDLTPYVSGHGWAGSVTTHVSPTYFEPKGDIAELGSGGLVRYGWGLENIQILATVRPPLYRFVYPGEPTIPYRRIFPRKDSLAGGAGRVYPQSNAPQTSNRVGGGSL